MNKLLDKIARAYARLNGFERALDAKDTAGPHVICRTSNVAHVHSPDFTGEVAEWKCKYCGRRGTHPDAPGTNTFSWEEPCEAFEPLDSEVEALAKRGREGFRKRKEP